MEEADEETRAPNFHPITEYTSVFKTLDLT